MCTSAPLSAALHLLIPPHLGEEDSSHYYTLSLLQLFSHYTPFSSRLARVLPMSSLVVPIFGKLKIHFHHSFYPISCGCRVTRGVDKGFSQTLIPSSAGDRNQSGFQLTGSLRPKHT